MAPIKRGRGWHNGVVRHRGSWPLAAGIAAGAALDALFGDPRRGHPVAAFGRAAAALEARDYADSRLRGAGHAAACVLAVAAPAALVHRCLRRWPPLEAAAVAAAVWAVTGARSLRHSAERMMASLHGNDLGAARQALPGLCGRDPDQLDAKDIARAVIESVAENTCDAAVAPLLWAAVAGLPGLAAYRAVNTLDAMVGYRSPRYLRFGWAAARLDDIANWVPARMTAALTVGCAPLVPGAGAAAALRVLRRDGARHPSPNAGRCEAAFAGALGVRLGGTNIYGGVAEDRPELGDGRVPEPDDIRRAVRLCRAVTAVAVLISAGGTAGRAARRSAPRWRPTTVGEGRTRRRR
ncbi:MAG: cobalamin biosynthesis protein [Streptosporangiaceae bacterium]|nr:cobalamin biosynthesis protein [Streptosporangiaceae bacterium]